MLALHEGALRADLMRYYGLSLDAAGEAYSWRDLAAICAHLPDGGAVARESGDGWSRAERLLASVEFSLRVLRWQPTKDGQKNRNAPVPPRSPREVERDAARADEYSAWDMDRIADALGIPEDRR